MVVASYIKSHNLTGVNSNMESDLINSYLVEVDNNVLHDEYVVNAEEQDEENSSDSTKNVPLREQDRFLPIANIVKIMKRAVPENGKIAKDARECVQECLSEFISFVTSEASDRCQVEKRKTINGEDVLFALHTLGFDHYVSPLKAYLKKYRELVLSPVTINKTSKTVVLFGEPYTSAETPENETESSTQSTVLLSYPKMEY